MSAAQALAHDTVDAIAWRHLGRTSGMIEAIFDLNPGLAALGAVLPEGTSVKLPPLATAANDILELVQLWD